MTERPALANQIRDLLMGDGLVIAQGIQRLRREWPELVTAETLPTLVRDVVAELRERLGALGRRIPEYDRRLAQLATRNESAPRVMPVEGVGPITASAIVATIGDGYAFQHARRFAAWVGVVPKQHFTGGSRCWGGSPNTAMCICARG